MSACLKLRGAWSALSYGCVCQRVRLVLPLPVRSLSFLTTRQHALTKPPPTDRSQQQTRTSPVAIHVIPHRHEVTFSKKRRTFKGNNAKDGVGPDMQLVYSNNMNRLSFWGQLVINVLALPVYGMCLTVIYSSWPNMELSVTSGSLGATLYIVAYSLLFTGVNSICRRSIQRIYTDADTSTFAAVVRDWKMTSQTVHFDLNSVERKPPGQITGVFRGNLKIQGRSYLVNPTDFIQPRYYNLLMGYELKRSIEQDIIRDEDINEMISRMDRSKLNKPSEKKRT